jgi:hypothetical protein
MRPARIPIYRLTSFLDAELFDQTEYGPKYRIRGTLTGPNGCVLRVLTIWMKEAATGETKFVTLLPDKL